MVYGYARCSTNELKQDIDRQKRELSNQGVLEENIYFEYESGTKLDRIQLDRLLETVQEGDTIVATEVSRITRSTSQLCKIIELTKQKKIKLVLGSFIFDCANGIDAITEGMLKLIGVIAELERNMIAERVKSGMANAKAKGKTIGRPKLTKENIPKAFFKFYPDYKNKRISKVEYSRLIGKTVPTLYKYLEIVEN